MKKINYNPPKDGIRNRFGMTEHEYSKRCNDMENALTANAAQIDYEMSLFSEKMNEKVD